MKAASKDLQDDYEPNCGKNYVVLRQIITVLIFLEGRSDLVVKQKWQKLQGAMEKCVKNCGCSSEFQPFQFRLRC